MKTLTKRRAGSHRPNTQGPRKEKKNSKYIQRKTKNFPQQCLGILPKSQERCREHLPRGVFFCRACEYAKNHPSTPHGKNELRSGYGVIGKKAKPKPREDE